MYKMDKSVEFIIGYTQSIYANRTHQHNERQWNISTKPKLAMDYNKMCNRI